MKIEFLYFESCANHEQALNLLQKILKEEGIESPVDLIKVESDEMAVELKFPGSPTIRINGQDVDPPQEASGFSQQCRVYHNDGILKGVPSEEKLKKIIRQGIE
ncbi:MAG: hypothetical protein NPINA01_10920 [Nitrospinaceae bacterium]|nr:MAG: hypothetical protein NPINA01_10920 [Nitrospinaceae bacterium]